MAQERIFTTEDTMNVIREKAKEADEFVMKVNRRAHMGSTPQLLASFSGARVEHFNNPELWLPQLCGGGKYLLQGFHSSDINKAVGGFVMFGVDNPEPCDVDPTAVKKPDWRGPPVLEFPQLRPTQRAATETFGYEIRSPPAPGEVPQRHQNNQFRSGQAGGGSVHNGHYEDGPIYDRDQRKQLALEQERRRLEAEKLELRDQKHRDELETLKRQHENDMRTFKAEILGELRSKPVDNGSSLMMEFMKVQVETARLAAAQAAEDRKTAEARALEDRRAAEARQERNDDRFNKLLEKMADKPKEDPLAVIEKVTNLMGKNNSGEAHLKMMNNMAEMHSMQMGTAMDFIQAAADMQLGGGQKEESTVVKAIDAGLKGLGAMVRGAAQQKQRAPQQFQQPTGTFEQQARQAPAGAPQQPAPAQQPQQQMQPQPGQPPTVLEQIKFGIWGYAPVKQVATAMIQHFQDPSIQAALIEARMDFEVAVDNLMGNWGAEKPQNSDYLKALRAELEAQLAAAGFFDQPGEPQGDQPEEEGEQEEEGEIVGDEAQE